jgi:hypothetical protein
MAGFKTHITGSTLMGIGYGAAGFAYGIPWPTCAVAGLGCSFAGMLPDLDSDSGVPVREMLSILAAVVPALMVPRFQQLGLQHEQLVLAMVVLYFAIRVGLGAVFKHYTAHRGMWHSLPAAAVAGLVTFELVCGSTLEIRLYKALAVVLGFVTHLVMDELWSVDLHGGVPRLKKSAGTALKLWTTNGLWPNISVYGKLFALVFLAIGDPYIMQRLGADQGKLPQSAREWLAHSAERSQQIFQRLLRRAQVGAPAPAAMFDQLPSSEPANNPPPPWPTFGNTPAAPQQPTAPRGDYQPPSAPPPYPAPPAAESARTPSYYPAGASPDRR